jgi:hypothetical protein
MIVDCPALSSLSLSPELLCFIKSAKTPYFSEKPLKKAYFDMKLFSYFPLFYVPLCVLQTVLRLPFLLKNVCDL